MRYKNLWKMPFFDEKRYKNSPETEGGTLWLFCEVFSFQSIGINRVLKRDFTSLIIQYIILDKDCIWTEYWGCWRDLIAMHHFGRTDGLFAGNKSFEKFNCCVVSVSVIVTNNSLMWQRSLFFKIALVVIFWIEKEVLFLFLFKLLLYLQYG